MSVPLQYTDKAQTELTLLHTTIEKLFQLALSSFTAYRPVSYTHLDVYKRQLIYSIK